MGKKARLKELRRIAGQMPEMSVKALQKEQVRGQVLLNEGKTEIGFEKINPVEMYEKKEVVKVPVNHKRRMHKLLKKYGVRGVQVYVDAVEDYKAKNEKS